MARERYDALRREIEELRRNGAQLPYAALQRQDRIVEESKRTRNLAAAERALDEIEALIAPFRRSASAVSDRSPGAAGVPTAAPEGNGKCGSPGEGADSFFGVGYAKPGLAAIYATTGVRWAKVPLVAWGRAEPNPSRNGQHRYRWGPLDKLIREYQENGFHLQIVLKAANPWAADPAKMEGGFQGPGRGAVSAFPAPNHVQDYQDWVVAIVERYDADGVDDMPGLIRPVLHWEIESEAQHEGYWRGTKEEYGELLKIANRAAKAACKDAKIILAGFNLGDIFEGVPDDRELNRRLQALPPFHQTAMGFIQYTLSLVDDYDEVEIHYNRDYRSLSKQIEWIREQQGERGRDKPIWSGDTISTVWLFQKERLEPLPYKDQAIYDALKKGNKNSEPARWFREEQSRISVKKFVTGAGENLVGMILETTADWPMPKSGPPQDFYKNWTVSGIIDDQQTPRPVYYALKQAVQHLDGFKEATPLESKDGIYIFQFSFDRKSPVFVAWSERGTESVVLDVPYRSAAMEPVVIEGSAPPAPVELRVTNGRVEVSIGETPRYIFSR